jgi:hypothetical protein
LKRREPSFSPQQLSEAVARPRSPPPCAAPGCGRSSEAASAEAKALLARLTQRHGKGKALSILAHKLRSAASYVLLREKPFDAKKFFATANA